MENRTTPRSRSSVFHLSSEFCFVDVKSRRFKFPMGHFGATWRSGGEKVPCLGRSSDSINLTATSKLMINETEPNTAYREAVIFEIKFDYCPLLWEREIYKS